MTFIFETLFGEKINEPFRLKSLTNLTLELFMTILTINFAKFSCQN